MTTTGAVALYVTCPSLAVADTIALHLLAARLAGSVNILPGAHSLYWWKGRIERADEVVLIAKTMAGRVDGGNRRHRRRPPLRYAGDRRLRHHRRQPPLSRLARGGSPRRAAEPDFG